MEAVEVIHAITKFNGKKSCLTVDIFKDSEKYVKAQPMDTSTRRAFMRKVRMMNSDHLKALFAMKQLADSTSLLIVHWAFIGLAGPLYSGFVTVL